MTKKKRIRRFRDPNTGQFIAKETFVQLVRVGKAPLKDASGERIRGRKADFVGGSTRQINIDKEEERQQRNQKRTVGVGGTGSMGRIETYVRYGFTTKRIAGSDGISARGAIVVPGRFDMRDVLQMTKPESFYRVWSEMGVKNLIESGELELLEGGVHYQIQERDINNNVFMLSEIRLEGKDLLRL